MRLKTPLLYSSFVLCNWIVCFLFRPEFDFRWSLFVFRWRLKTRPRCPCYDQVFRLSFIIYVRFYSVNNTLDTFFFCLKLILDQNSLLICLTIFQCGLQGISLNNAWLITIMPFIYIYIYVLEIITISNLITTVSARFWHSWSWSSIWIPSHQMLTRI